MSNEISAREIFALRLKVAIALNGMNQAEFARKMGFSQPLISNYLNEKTTPDYETLRKIARSLGVSIDFLLGR